MLTERDLRETIEECRAVKKPTAATCQLMASCYTILDHLFPEMPRSVEPPVQMYSMASAPESEFAEAAIKAGRERTLEVLDEHMECIRALYPKEYKAVLRMLGE